MTIRTCSTSTRAAAGSLLALSLLTACSSTGSPSAAPPSPTGTASSSAPSSVPAAVTVPLGTTETLASDTVTVSAFHDKAAPTARKPDTAGAHWATAAVKQCATGPSRATEWQLALADGQSAPQTTSWPEELPTPFLGQEEPLADGDCLAGLVYFVVPDGAIPTGVVLQPATTPSRPQVTWTIA